MLIRRGIWNSEILSANTVGSLEGVMAMADGGDEGGPTFRYLDGIAVATFLVSIFTLLQPDYGGRELSICEES